MTKFKVVLFDVDGVLIKPPRLFSEQYCEKYGVDPKLQVRFYSTKEFKNASIGKFDLKDALRIHNDKWQWQGDPEELLNMWFEGENYPNEELFEVIKKLRQDGVLVYLATQQEKYRAAYLKDAVFQDKIDGMFCSCDIGYSKHVNEFWQTVLNKLQRLSPGIVPDNIAFFDDRKSNVDIAKRFGIVSFLYTTNEQFKADFNI